MRRAIQKIKDDIAKLEKELQKTRIDRRKDFLEDWRLLLASYGATAVYDYCHECGGCIRVIIDGDDSSLTPEDLCS